jgi:hypothetical protein
VSIRHGAPAGCPQCGRMDYVSRVAGIVASDQSALATALSQEAPPRPPAQVRNPGAIFAAIAWLIPSIVLATVSGAGILAFLLIYAAGVGAYGIYYAFGRNSHHVKAQLRHESYRRHRDQYEQIVEMWGRLEYCGRCHGVYLPGNEWQAAINPELELVPANRAWGYALDLMRYAWGQEQQVVVNDRGEVGRRAAAAR